MTQTEKAYLQTSSFVGQFSWLMCPALSSFGEAFDAKEVVAIYSLTKLGLLAQSPLESWNSDTLGAFQAGVAVQGAESHHPHCHRSCPRYCSTVRFCYLKICSWWFAMFLHFGHIIYLFMCLCIHLFIYLLLLLLSVLLLLLHFD